MDGQAKAIAQAPNQLREQARLHKRMAGQHRREARRLMQQADQLEAELAALGIAVVYQQPPTGD